MLGSLLVVVLLEGILEVVEGLCIRLLMGYWLVDILHEGILAHWTFSVLGEVDELKFLRFLQ